MSRKNYKQRLLDVFGGECYVCGYNRSPLALEFHHKDKSTKEFNISEQRGGFTKHLKEAIKCVLLCSNCHREAEYGIDIGEVV